MKNTTSIYDGKSAKELRKMAEDLRSGKNTLDYEWDSSDDRKRFADIVDKVAELKDICPAIQGSFALEVEVENDNYHRHSPTLVISEDTVATTSESKEDQEADVCSTRCELIHKQVGSLADTLGLPSEELLGKMMAAAFVSRRNISGDKKMEIRLRALASVLPIIGALIDMKKEAIAATMALAVQEILKGDSDSEDESKKEEPEESEKDDSEKDDHTLKVVELKGEEADKAIKELLKVLGKKENKDDGECGGSCCRKCSKNKDC